MKPRNWLWILLAVFIAGKLLFMLRPHLVIWDEAVYIAMGKHLWSWSSSGLWEIGRPVLLPVALGFLWLLGLSPVAFGEILAVLISALCIYLVYVFGSKAWNERAGLLAAAFLAFTPLYFLYSSYILTEIPSAVVAMLAMLALLKNRHLLAGVIAALSLLTRLPQGLVLVVLLAAVVVQHKKDYAAAKRHAARVVIGFGIVMLAFMAFNGLRYYDETGNVFTPFVAPLLFGIPAQANPSNAVTGIEGLAFYWKHFVAKAWFNLLVVIGAGYALRRAFKTENRTETTLLLWLLIYAAYYTLIPSKEDRYGIVFLPAVALFAGYGFDIILQKWKNTAEIGLRTIARVIVVLAVLFSLWQAARQDTDYYQWRFAEEPAVVTEFYKYFATRPAPGVVLTTDPVPSAYTDAAYSTYFIFDQPYRIKDRLSQGEAGAVMYRPGAFFCAADDTACLARREATSQDFISKYTVALNKTFNGEQYYVFVKP